MNMRFVVASSETLVSPLFSHFLIYFKHKIIIFVRSLKKANTLAIDYLKCKNSTHEMWKSTCDCECRKLKFHDLKIQEPNLILKRHHVKNGT